MSTRGANDNGVVVSSGNVFADLGVENSDEELAKAQLSLAIRQRITAKGLSQSDAADLLDAEAEEVGKLPTGRAGEFTYDRLLGFLNALAVDVRIVVKPADAKERGTTLVVAG